MLVRQRVAHVAPERELQRRPVATALWAAQERWQDEIDAGLVDALLETANDWASDMDEPAMTGEQSLSRLRLETVSFDEGGELTFWFDDGDVFAGHVVNASGSLGEGIRRCVFEGQRERSAAVTAGRRTPFHGLPDHRRNGLILSVQFYTNRPGTLYRRTTGPRAPEPRAAAGGSNYSSSISSTTSERGELRQRYRDGMEDQPGALGLVLNIIVLFNTRYMNAALEKLRADGFPVNEQDVARLSPLIRKHINIQGHYAFAFAAPDLGGCLRALQSPDRELRRYIAVTAPLSAESCSIVPHGPISLPMPREQQSACPPK